MSIKCIALALSFIGAMCLHALAAPKNVIIIRHAEKGPQDKCLTLQGLERAAALPYYFSDTSLFKSPITHVFAAHDKSYLRAKQTCAPIAEHSNLALNINFKPEDATSAANEILTNPQYEGGTILLCWSHRYISPLVEALGGQEQEKWPEEIFDQVYVLTYNEKRKPSFQRLLQKLMFGDRINFDEKPRPLPPISRPCPVED